MYVCKHDAEIVKKQTSIGNDPVFRFQTLKRETSTKSRPKLSVKNLTIHATGVDPKTPRNTRADRD